MISKAELHVHIEGAAPPELARKLAARSGVDVSGVIGDGGYIWRDFSEFLDVYAHIAALFRTPEDFADLAEGYLTDIAAQGAIYCEFFAAPQLAPIPTKDYLDGLAEGARRAALATGIDARIIPIIARHLGPDSAVAMAQNVAKLAHPNVVGFGMGGDERMYDPLDFKEAFDIASEAGLGLTCHAGEFAGPHSVRGALALGATRIGHGVRAIEDPELVAELVDRGIVLEVCPGSNISLGVYTDWAKHPFKRLRDAGVKVTLNADDPPFFATSLAREYAMAAQHFGLSDNDLQDVTQTALAAAFGSPPATITTA